MPTRYLEDLREGEPLRCRPVTMTREEIIDFAVRFDPQPFHIDEAAADLSMFGSLIASSIHTIAACTRVIVEAQGDIAILSGVGMKEAAMFNPVFPGDVLAVDAWWAEIRRSKSKPDRGLASILCKVANQRNQPVINFGYLYMIACRSQGKGS